MHIRKYKENPYFSTVSNWSFCFSLVKNSSCSLEVRVFGGANLVNLAKLRRRASTGVDWNHLFVSIASGPDMNCRPQETCHGLSWLDRGPFILVVFLDGVHDASREARQLAWMSESSQFLGLARS
jgi:hypothetical protein